MKKTQAPVSPSPEKAEGPSASDMRGQKPASAAKRTQAKNSASKRAAPQPQAASATVPKPKPESKPKPKAQGRTTRQDIDPASRQAETATQLTPELATKPPSHKAAWPVKKTKPSRPSRRAPVASDTASQPAPAGPPIPREAEALPVMVSMAAPVPEPADLPMSAGVAEKETAPVLETPVVTVPGPLVQAVSEPAPLDTWVTEAGAAPSPNSVATTALTVDANVPTDVPGAGTVDLASVIAPAATDAPPASTVPAVFPSASSVADAPALSPKPASPRRPAKAKKRKASSKTPNSAADTKASMPARAKPRAAPAVDPAVALAQMLEQARAALVLDEAQLWEKDNPVKARVAQLQTRHALLQEQLQRLKPPFHARGKKP